MRRLDLTGKKFGHLTAIELVDHPIGQHRRNWLCKCDCGETTIRRAGTLTTGHATTCGSCNLRGNFKHGHSRTREYHIWVQMRLRCTRPSYRNFRLYGGRGICVCDRWENSFDDFLADVGPRPSDKHSLERLDCNGNYEPGNVVWADAYQQNGNRRTSNRVAFHGETICAAEFARRIGVVRSTVNRALRRGMTADQIVSSYATHSYRASKDPTDVPVDG